MRSQSIAEILLLLVSENKQPPHWNISSLQSDHTDQFGMMPSVIFHQVLLRCIHPGQS